VQFSDFKVGKKSENCKSAIQDFRFGLHILPALKSENCTFQLFEYISTSYYNLCVSSIYKYTINEKVFAKHRKIKGDILYIFLSKFLESE
jgi:hypothetical protein